MATSLRKLILIAVLSLFMLSETGCVGLIVTAIVVKKKRDRARAAAAQQVEVERTAEELTLTDKTEGKDAEAKKDAKSPE